MKKLMCLLLVVTLGLSSMLCAEETEGKANKESERKVQKLIDDGLADNQAEITAAAALLSAAQKDALIKENSKGTWPVVLNIFVGYGVGSWVEGDKVGGLVGSIGDGVTELGAIISYSAGYIASFQVASRAASTSDSSVTYEDIIRPGLIGYAIGTAFAVLNVGVYIFQIVRGATYPGNYNKLLETTVRGDGNKEISFDFTPSIQFDKDNNAQLALACQMKF
jgi:hypothetical protein